MKNTGFQFVQIVVVAALAGGGVALAVASMRQEPAPQRRTPTAGSSAEIAAEIAELEAGSWSLERQA